MLRKSRTHTLERLMPALSNLYNAMASSRDSFLAQFNLSRSQMEILVQLKNGPHTTTQLAKNFHISASAVSQMVDQLTKKNLAERRNDTKDRRIAYIQLSEKGTVLFEDINTKFLEHIEIKFATVSSREIDNLVNVITKVTKTVTTD